MKPGKVRTIAICVFEHNGKLLVHDGYDEIKGQHFGRPLGGRIEFGEYSRDTIIRELREEIGAEVTDLRYLGTLENIFTFNDETGHEVVLIYRGRLVDPALYTREVIQGCEDSGEALRAVWLPRADFQSGKLPLYPTGLLELLNREETA